MSGNGLHGMFFGCMGFDALRHEETPVDDGGQGICVRHVHGRREKAEENFFLLLPVSGAPTRKVAGTEKRRQFSSSGSCGREAAFCPQPVVSRNRWLPKERDRGKYYMIICCNNKDATNGCRKGNFRLVESAGLWR